MASIFIPNPIAALPPARAMFRPVPPAQTGAIWADALTSTAGILGQGIQGFQQAKAEKKNTLAMADYLDSQGNSDAAALFREQANNINPFFSSGSGGSGGGGFGGSGGGLVRDILRSDLQMKEIDARHENALALQENSADLQRDLLKIPSASTVETSARAYVNTGTQLVQAGLLSPEGFQQMVSFARDNNLQGMREALGSNIIDPEAAARTLAKIDSEIAATKQAEQVDRNIKFAESLKEKLGLSLSGVGVSGSGGASISLDPPQPIKPPTVSVTRTPLKDPIDGSIMRDAQGNILYEETERFTRPADQIDSPSDPLDPRSQIDAFRGLRRR